VTQVDLWVGLGAAVAGSGVGAIGAWQGNLIVEKRRENLQVLGAMEMLELEIRENADRLRRGVDPGSLPLGVWSGAKPILAGIGRRTIPDELWERLNGSYGRIYDAQRGARLDANEAPLDAEELDRLRADFKLTADEFAREIRSFRFWVLPEPRRRR
jgi:hypothetical protein